MIKTNRKRDSKLYAASQKHEVRYVLKRFPLIEKKVVESIAKKAGRSRAELYKILAQYMYKNFYSKQLN